MQTDRMRRRSVALYPVRLALVPPRVHWVRPELVVEVKYLVGDGDGLVRQVVHEGVRKNNRRPDCAPVRATRADPGERSSRCFCRTGAAAKRGAREPSSRKLDSPGWTRAIELAMRSEQEPS